ncbi:MAG: hypothetical protein LBE22_03235 [Azoarcus sp.]|nr:hypothetical protein [Azoarcus sp.]
METFQCNESNNSPVWGIVDLFRWKVLSEEAGGGKQYIQKFKDAWVHHNREKIKSAAHTYGFPPELLAGVCWIEVGGDPNFIDRVAFEVRSFDWSGPPVIDKLAITRHPTKTSFGSVSIQLRTAAQTLGLNSDEMDTAQLRKLANCLERDMFNIDTVAKHLKDLIARDKLTSPFSMDDVRIIGARYNRGTGLSLKQIKENTSYGNFIVNFWPRFTELLR